MRLLFFFFPGAVLLLATVGLLEGRLLGNSLADFARLYPLVVFSAGVVLAWGFNRSRIVYALLALALANWALYRFTAPGLNAVIYPAVACLLPLNLAAFPWLDERGLLTPRGLLRAGVLLLQVVAVALLTHPGFAGLARILRYSPLDSIRLPALLLPQLALLFFLLAFLLLLFRYLLRQGAMEKGFLWALLAAFLGLNAGAPSPAATIYLATAGLILAVSVIETSHAMAYRDDLTGLPARRALTEALLRLGNTYTIAMVDVDHFKSFNDTYGHHVGDQVLRMVASRLARVAGGGKAFRYGGEEFAVLFPGATTDDALPHLEALRQEIESTAFAVRGPGRPRRKPKEPIATGPLKKVSITVSVGVAEPTARTSTPAAVIAAADQALYRAKKAGRNQIKT